MIEPTTGYKGLCMQIKIRGRNVQLLRSEYLPGKKRSVQKSIGTFDASDCLVITEVPQSILDELDEAELQELEEWFQKRADQRKELRPYLPPAMSKALQNAAIATEIAADLAVDIDIDENDVGELVRVWHKLTRVIRSKNLQPHLIFLPPSVNDPEKIERILARYVKVHREAELEKGQRAMQSVHSREAYEDYQLLQLHAEEEKGRLVKGLIAELQHIRRA
jgi:hypothetical protein